MVNFQRCEVDEAVVLSNTAVMGNGLAQFLINSRRRHPLAPERTLIDWNAVLMLLPSQVNTKTKQKV